LDQVGTFRKSKLKILSNFLNIRKNLKKVGKIVILLLE